PFAHAGDISQKPDIDALCTVQTVDPFADGSWHPARKNALLRFEDCHLTTTSDGRCRHFEADESATYHGNPPPREHLPPESRRVLQGPQIVYGGVANTCGGQAPRA